MSDRQDAFRESVEANRRKRAGFFFNYPGPWEFFFSEAGRSVASHPSAIPVWLLIISKQPFPPKKRERMRLEKLGLWPPKKPKEFSFPLEEGPIHGVGKKATASGLRVLHDVGAIDRLHPGSATRGKFATYALSDRWRQWRPPGGGPDFMVLEWEKAPVIGTRDTTILDEDGNVIRKGTGRFLRRRTPKTSRKVHVVAPKATNNPLLVAPKSTREKPLVAPKAMNKPPDAELLVAPKAVFLSSTYSDPGPRSGRKVEKPWQPPLSEIRENVAEILRQRPDPRAEDTQFVRLISDQLGEVLSGRLNSGRVHRDFQQKHGFDDWTADLLFTTATINLIPRGAIN